MRVVWKRLGDWRIPLIFAAPILVWAAVGYLALQPLPAENSASQEGSVVFTESPTPSPWRYQPVDKLETASPPVATPNPCVRETIGYIIRTDNGVVTEAIPGHVCIPGP